MLPVRYALLFASWLCCGVFTQAAERPNVIVVLSDDQGWGDLSLHGNPNLSTPNLDSMARDGAQLRHFYVCAVCSPTRAEFLTGRYHSRMGVYSTSAGGERFNADEQTIADVFRMAGYATAAYGKWHSGMQYPYHPNARGFQDYYGFCSGHWGNYFSPMLEHNGRIVKGDGFLVDDLFDHAMEFIQEHRAEPFFVYLPLNTPHSPMQVPDKFWDRFKDKTIVPDPTPENAKKQNLVHTRAALAMCENIDENMGRLLNHLEQQELADNTIVIYFSDNGPNGSRFNAGMRGRKGSTHEGGLRSPCLIRFPKRIKPGTEIDSVCAAIDLLPTLADFAGIQHESPKPLDGESITKQLCDADLVPEDRMVFSAWNGKTTVRTNQYRYHGSGMLFDIQSDPREQKDLSKTKVDIAAELKTALDRWVQDVKPMKAKGQGKRRPFALAHPDAIYTQLPARDAKPMGGVQRSNRFPNCTFMHNWTSTEDAIVWELDVLSEGQYEVEMYYACPEASIGSVLELSLGSEVIRATIQEANDAPLLGAEDDRFERVEGYVREWKTMKLGRIRTNQGRKMLTLKALEIPGATVCDMRLLMFRKLD